MTYSFHLESESIKFGFDRIIRLEYYRALVSSNGEFFTYRDLDHVLGLFDPVSSSFIDKRTGRHIQNEMPTLLQQSTYSRLAGQEILS